MPQHVLEQFNLTGRRALITGGGKGLGKVIATALAQAGADVAVSARSLADVQAVAAEIAASTGCKTFAVAADVTKDADVRRMAEATEAALGPIDILVNNAGVNVRNPTADYAESDWDAVIDVNLKGTFLCARAIAPGMATRGWGRIVNLGSTLSIIALPHRPAYAAAKAGVLNLTKVLALEYAGTGVTANALCPGPFATEMNRPLLDDPEKFKALAARIPMARWGELDEITGAALFLASPASSFVTGTSLLVDGGWTAQ